MDDAFGRMVRDHYVDELGDAPVHRRDDGETWDAVVGWYFAPPAEWSDLERAFVDRTTGRTLDVGCGVGRSALYVQRAGREVVGVDRSPMALAVARARGLRHAVATDMERLGVRDEFDTLLVLGGQLGAPGTRFSLRKALRELAAVATPNGRLVADLLDPTEVDDPDRAAYLQSRQIGDGVALRRFRVEYGQLEGPWIDLLCLTPSSFRELLRDTPWRIDTLEATGSEKYYVELKLA